MSATNGRFKTGIEADIANGGDPYLYKRAANGNVEAYKFLVVWHEYCHEIDDLVDNGETDPQKWLTVLAHANLVYSTPFYAAWARDLRLIVMLVTNAYADSLQWEGSETDWKQRWGDVLRFSGIEMVYAVASLCGGYNHMREISKELRENAWNAHHNETGVPC